VWLGAKIGLRNKDDDGREPAPKRKTSPVKRPAVNTPPGVKKT
jgi:hypothetical protein